MHVGEADRLAAPERGYRGPRDGTYWDCTVLCYVYIYIYIHIERERVREKERYIDR